MLVVTKTEGDIQTTDQKSIQISGRFQNDYRCEIEDYRIEQILDRNGA